jgi:hypothetical protein
VKHSSKFYYCLVAAKKISNSGTPSPLIDKAIELEWAPKGVDIVKHINNNATIEHKENYLIL